MSKYDIKEPFMYGYARVMKDGKWNLVDESGRLLSKEWFFSVSNFSDYYFNHGYADVVTREGKHMRLYYDGRLVE